MNPISRTFFKIIMTVLAVFIVIAAVPIFRNAYQSLGYAPIPPSNSGLASESQSGTESALMGSNEAAVQRTPVGSNPASGLSLSNQELLSGNSQPIGIPGRTDSYGNVYLLVSIYKTDSDYPYKIQDGTPTFIQNFGHAYAGCSWMSVAGQVINPEGGALSKLVVSVKGTLNGNPVDLLGLTGLSQVYGPGGYEIQLGSSPIASNGNLSIQVFDLNGNPLSEAIPFNTSADCSENVVLINFAP